MAKPQKTLKDEEAVDYVMKYLKKQNRPYSAVDVYNNIHGVVGKTLVQKILQKASEENKIKEKVYGKQKVYAALQDEKVITKEELEQMDETIKKLEEQLKHSLNKTNILKSKLKNLNSSMTDDQINEKIKRLSKENLEFEKRINTLSKGIKLISKEEQDKINKNLKNNNLEWKKRKKMFKYAWDTITENIQKNPKDLMEELGIETDD